MSGSWSDEPGLARLADMPPIASRLHEDDVAGPLVGSAGDDWLSLPDEYVETVVHGAAEPPPLDGPREHVWDGPTCVIGWVELPTCSVCGRDPSDEGVWCPGPRTAAR